MIADWNYSAKIMFYFHMPSFYSDYLCAQMKKNSSFIIAMRSEGGRAAIVKQKG